MATHQSTLLVRLVRRLFFAGVAFLAVAMDFHGDPTAYFSYFTILTNLSIGVWFLAAALYPRFEGAALMRLALTVCGLVTVSVYWILLAPTHHPEGLHFVANLLLHVVVPVAMAVEDLLVPWPTMRRGTAFWVLLFPLAYCIFSLVRGELTGWYPYFFLNKDEVGGWGPLAGFVLALFVVFVALAYGWRTVVSLRHRSATAT